MSEPPRTIQELLERCMADPTLRAAIEAERDRMRREQDAPLEYGSVSWKVGRNFGATHVVWPEDAYRTACMRWVPRGVAVDRSDQEPTCAGCAAVLRTERRKRMEVVK